MVVWFEASPFRLTLRFSSFPRASSIFISLLTVLSWIFFGLVTYLPPQLSSTATPKDLSMPSHSTHSFGFIPILICSHNAHTLLYLSVHNAHIHIHIFYLYHIPSFHHTPPSFAPRPHCYLPIILVLILIRTVLFHLSLRHICICILFCVQFMVCLPFFVGLRCCSRCF